MQAPRGTSTHGTPTVGFGTNDKRRMTQLPQLHNREYPLHVSLVLPGGGPVARPADLLANAGHRPFADRRRLFLGGAVLAPRCLPAGRSATDCRHRGRSPRDRLAADPVAQEP